LRGRKWLEGIKWRPLETYAQSAPALGALFTAQLAGDFSGVAVSGAVTN